MQNMNGKRNAKRLRDDEEEVARRTSDDARTDDDAERLRDDGEEVARRCGR